MLTAEQFLGIIFAVFVVYKVGYEIGHYRGWKEEFDRWFSPEKMQKQPK